MRGLLVAKGEEVSELGLGADRPELTRVNQTPFHILPRFQPHISVVFTISSSSVNIFDRNFLIPQYWTKVSDLILSGPKATITGSFSLQWPDWRLCWGIQHPLSWVGGCPIQRRVPVRGRAFLSKVWLVVCGDGISDADHPNNYSPLMFSVQSPENHGADVSGPGHPEHVQMIPTLSPVWERRKRNGKGHMRSSKQANPQWVLARASYE